MSPSAANSDCRVVNRAIPDRHQRPAVLPFAAAYAKANFVVLEYTILDLGLNMVFQIQCRHVADLPRLIPTRQEAIANGQTAPRVGGRLLGIDRVFARLLPRLNPAASSASGAVQRLQFSISTPSHGPRPGSN